MDFFYCLFVVLTYHVFIILCTQEALVEGAKDLLYCLWKDFFFLTLK